jgi:DNA polymerase III subunit delta
MPSLTLEQAFRSLRKGEVAPAFCLSGPADLLKGEFADAIVEAVLPPGTRDFNLDIRSAGDLDGESLHALIETPPMLADRRVVVVRGIEQWRKNAKVWEILVRYLTHPASTTVLVLTHSGSGAPDPRATRGAVHVEVGPLTPRLAVKWLRRRATELGVALAPDAADHLLAAVGDDLGALAQELAKLAAATHAGATVSAADVSALVGIRRGETVSDWVQAVVRRDTAHAPELLDVVLRQGSVTGVQLVMALGTALVGVRLARALADAGTPWPRLRSAVFERIKAARPAGVRQWGSEAALWSEAARSWTAEELDAAIAAAAEADRRLKSTTISDERGVLLTMLFALPRPRAVA